MRPTAAELLSGNHALSNAFYNWCVAHKSEPSKRQARKYLAWLDNHNMKWAA